jgi:hypothetical protein
MYNILEFDTQFGIPAIVAEDDATAEDKFQQGTQVEADETPVNPMLASDTTLDEYPDYFNALRAPIASDRLKKALLDAKVDNIEWFPVEIRTPEKAIPGYNIMNVIGRVACLDEAASQVTRWRNKIARIKSLKVDPNRARDATIFRLHEYPELILIHERLTPVLKDFTGLLVLPSDGWSDESRF